jgi:hypothetical protein
LTIKLSVIHGLYLLSLNSSWHEIPTEIAKDRPFSSTSLLMFWLIAIHYIWSTILIRSFKSLHYTSSNHLRQDSTISSTIGTTPIFSLISASCNPIFPCVITIYQSILIYVTLHLISCQIYTAQHYVPCKIAYVIVVRYNFPFKHAWYFSLAYHTLSMIIVYKFIIWNSQNININCITYGQS